MKTGKMIAALVVALLACVAVAGNTSADEEEKKPAPAPEAKELAEAHNKFGIEVFKKLHEGGENTFISPTSIAVCLQMARQGADGETRDEMDEAMHLAGIDVPKSNRALLNELGGREGVKLNIANSMWADPQRLNLNQEYADEIIDYFDSEARIADFSDPKTLAAVNGWISDKTEQMIPKMLDSINRNDVMFLINAIYFKGDWTTPFKTENTTEQDWHNADGTTRKMPLMKRSARIRYREADGHQIAKLPYGADKQSSMLIVLPKDTESMDDLIDGLTPEKVADWNKSIRKRQGTLRLPRFEMKYKKTLNKSLQGLGIKTAFQLGKADFTRMGESPLGPLFIGRVLHESRVVVNEEGTEAAAATIVGMTAGGPPPKPFSMTCDRPFLFFIMDEPTDAVLFMGTVFKPEEPTR